MERCALVLVTKYCVPPVSPTIGDTRGDKGGNVTVTTYRTGDTIYHCAMCTQAQVAVMAYQCPPEWQLRYMPVGIYRVVRGTFIPNR